jgi:hypothetical protein
LRSNCSTALRVVGGNGRMVGPVSTISPFRSDRTHTRRRGTQASGPRGPRSLGESLQK